ncbi:hypothetical protein [Nocardia sp. NPDC050435]|uniref:hypothetical protein n=1 Tax=Nocardia sp. NPDC050435 TaxID=3155040 RepID=UPI00340DC985
MITSTLYDTWLAVDSITPENPPISESLYKLARWGLWFSLFGGAVAIVFGGGVFAWEKWNGGMVTSTRMISGALIGGIIASSSAAILNAVIPT